MAAKKKELPPATAAAVVPPEAPGAETAHGPKPTPGRKQRFNFYPDGKDYVLLSVQTDDQGEPVPNGALSAIPNTPRFESGQDGERWVRSSGERLEGMRVLCVKMMWSMRVLVQQKPVITVTKEERFAATAEQETAAAAAE